MMADPEYYGCYEYAELWNKKANKSKMLKQCTGLSLEVHEVRNRESKSGWCEDTQSNRLLES